MMQKKLNAAATPLGRDGHTEPWRGHIRLASGAALLPALFVAPASAWSQEAPQYYGRHMMHDGWFGWFFGPIMMIMFIAVVVVIIVLLVRWLGGPSYGATPHAPHGKTAVDILKERFARGEIDKEEFEERRRLLE